MPEHDESIRMMILRSRRRGIARCRLQVAPSLELNFDLTSSSLTLRIKPVSGGASYLKQFHQPMHRH